MRNLNLKNTLLGVFVLLLAIGCKPKKQGDLIILDATIQLADSALTKADAMVIGGGKVLAIGSKKELLSLYKVDSQMSFQGKFIYPGIIDAHCHFYGLGMFLQMVDLSETKSFKDVVDVCMKYYSKQTKNYLLGRGWDQNKWASKSFPSNEELNNAFPDIPVVLKRVDGHAAIANNYALKLAGITAKTKVDGGEVVLMNGKCSGVLIDNAVDLLENVIPKPSTKEKIKALLDAQDLCFSYGITAVTDAGLETEIINLIDSLQKVGLLKMRINAMVSLTAKNLEYWLKRGVYKTDYLQVNSFKMYGDGALGSRGACLLQPYSDMPSHSGFLLTNATQMEEFIEELSRSPFQLCTHAIGDSTNRLLLKLYGRYVGNLPDRRWRIEHAQVIEQSDFNHFGQYGIVPSVQPTHATSDKNWAIERLGSNRIKGAYAYQTLLKQIGWMPLGTDFPVEAVSPFFTFYAAVARQDASGMPVGGFQLNEALTREQAFFGITTWAAKGAFLESEMGSLVPGTFADFVVLETDLFSHNLPDIRKTISSQTYSNGLRVK
ncbi:MAG: amidohydrolase [Bacteroidetes bacterium B1(2017)]|nr:MAG: amidohydrolase [Bacteroidetes bacterium B1(2017)]